MVLYSAWVDRTVEKINWNILSALCIILIAWKLATHDWLSLIGIAPTLISKTPMERLGTNVDVAMRISLKVMTSIQPHRALKQLMRVVKRPHTANVTKKHNTERLPSIAGLSVSSPVLHKDVLERNDARRERVIGTQSQATDMLTSNFVDGDSVNVCKLIKSLHTLAYL